MKKLSKLNIIGIIAVIAITITVLYIIVPLLSKHIVLSIIFGLIYVFVILFAFGACKVAARKTPEKID